MSDVILNRVSKVFDRSHIAVSHVSLQVKHGEFMVLVGPSGCGKTTVLRMIAGLEEITSGEVSIGDRLVNNVSPKNRDIAMVFQNYALYPHMSVYDNMAFGLKLRRVPKNEIQQRVIKAASILGLEDVLKRKPRALSGGQRQRVAMGRAIIRKPAVFLFDEPLSNLDTKMRTEMRKEIIQLHRQLAATMIYVTHDQTEAMTLGDRICVMNKGIIEQIGPPGVIFNHPASLFVARFMGSPSMNIFEGTLRTEQGDPVFDGGTIQCPLSAGKFFLPEIKNGQNICLGIRPGALQLLKSKESAGPVIKGTVEISEMLGETALLHVTNGQHRFTANISPQEAGIPPGTEVCFSINLKSMHLFDSETGKNMTLPIETERLNTP